MAALEAAGRRYTFEALAPVVAVGEREAALRLLGPPYSDAARTWLLGQARAQREQGEIDARLLERLRDAHAGVAPGGLDDRDVALVQLLGARQEVAWERLQPELLELMRQPNWWLRHAAAKAWADHTDALPEEVRAVALDTCSEKLLARWARSAEHDALLEAAAQARDTSTWLELWSSVFDALVGAGRSYPWPRLAWFAAELEGEEDPYYAAEMRVPIALLRLCEHPLPAGARLWLVRADAAALFSVHASHSICAELEAIPAGERTPEEGAVLAGHQEMCELAADE